MQQLRYAVQHGLPLFALYSEEAGWKFGGDEQRRAVKWVMEVVGALEAMVFRKKAERQYERGAGWETLAPQTARVARLPEDLPHHGLPQTKPAYLQTV
eukprot:g36901.t1